MAFVVGANLVTSADSASPSGTSIPVTKGGTGATTEQGALQNLLPDFDSNNGKVLGSTGTEIGWVEQTKSSNDIGKVKIDSTDKTMTVNGETMVYNGVVYSLNRHDLWPNGIELNFGNNLYGMRKEGTISVDANGSAQVLFGTIAALFVGGDGEYQRGTDAVWYSVNGSSPNLTSVLFRQGSIRWQLVSTSKLTDIPYNIWVTYKK
jgi:hypothetical protein